MRCKSCNLRLEAFDDFEMCKRCINASKDTSTRFKDYQHQDLTKTKQGCVITLPKTVKE